HARGRRRARPGLHDRVRRHALRLLPAGRIHGDPGRLGDRRGDVPRRLDGPRAGLARPDLDAAEDVRAGLRLHLGAGDVAAPPLRPTDDSGVESAAAVGDLERARHRDPRGGDLMPDDVYVKAASYLDGLDVVE